MELMLRLLHHKGTDISLRMEPKSLALLAMHSDKYDCSLALKPWIAHWCSPSQDVGPEDIGHALLAAYMFRAPQFSGITAQAAKQLPLNFQSVWEDEILNLLPETITGQPLLHPC